MITPADDADSFDEMQREYALHDPEASAASEKHDDPLSTDELERLYQQALRSVEATEAFEAQLGLSEEPEASPEETPAETTRTNETSPRSADSSTATPARPTVRPWQIIESALFVGGTELTLKKLARLLGESTTEEKVEKEIDALNRHYSEQNRPYEILFGEGGYRLSLKSEFERIRNRVYGFGPKDVRLSQESLEVLALVAYRQPIAKAAVEKARAGTGSVLNQLLRRELVALERTGTGRNEVEYTTTPRFLQLFGLGDLKDLPHPDDLSFK